MALFKIFKGPKDNLGVTGGTNYAHEGYAYFTTDDGKFYIDVSGGNDENNPDSAVIGENRIPVNAVKADIADGAGIATTANSVAYYSDTSGTFASDSDFRWNADTNILDLAATNSGGAIKTSNGALSINANTNLILNNSTNNSTIFKQNSTERGRINKNGNFILGTLNNNNENLLNLNDTYGNYYLDSRGTPNANNDNTLGNYIAVNPGDVIYYTGKVGTTDATNITRRLHVYDSDKQWIEQLDIQENLNVDDSWSVHGTIPANGAYVRVSWGITDTELMIEKGVHTSYIAYDTNNSAEDISAYKLYVSGDSYFSGASNNAGNINPTTTNTYSLGSTNLRWKELRIGTADSYGSSTQPIYWNNGVPAVADGILTNSISGNAATATNATNDANGDQIDTTYLKLSGGTMTGSITFPSQTTNSNTKNIIFSSGGSIRGNTNGNIDIYGQTDFNTIPTAPTAADGTNDTSLATTAFVMKSFKANDAMIFKGTIGSVEDHATVQVLPSKNYHSGWTYKVATEDTYAGQPCEIGDLIIALKTGLIDSEHPDEVNEVGDTDEDVIVSDWVVVQNNIDGAVFTNTPGSAVGSATHPVYIASNGAATETTYELGSTLNGGTENTIAYYSGDNAVSSGSITTGANGSYLADVDSLTINSNYQTTHQLYVNGTSGFTDSITLLNNNNAAKSAINFSRANYNYINVPTSGSLAVTVGGIANNNIRFVVGNSSVHPYQSDGSITLGTSSIRWGTIYGTGEINLENSGETKVQVKNIAVTPNRTMYFLADDDTSQSAGLYDGTHSFWAIRTVSNGSTYVGSKASQSITFKQGSTDISKFDTNGYFLPGATDTYYLGSSGNSAKRWKGLYLGTADSYGSVIEPIYWNDGVPEVAGPFQINELIYYANQATSTIYYIKTDIKVGNNSCWIFGTLTGTNGNDDGASLDVKFQAFWNQTTITTAYYYDPLDGLENFTSYVVPEVEDGNNIKRIYLSFQLKNQYSQIRAIVRSGNGTGSDNANINRAINISTTAPSDDNMITKVATRSYISTQNGGTGNNTFTTNRLLYTESATKIASTNHSATTTKIAINDTTTPGASSPNLLVNGTTTLSHNPAVNTPILKIESTSTGDSVGTGTYQWGFTYLVNSLGNGGNAAFLFGKSATSGNSAEILYHHDSTANERYIGLGFHSAIDKVKVYYNGRTHINNGNGYSGLDNTYGLRIGLDNSTHLDFGHSGIQALKTTVSGDTTTHAVSPLYLQYSGGNISINAPTTTGGTNITLYTIKDGGIFLRCKKTSAGRVYAQITEYETGAAATGNSAVVTGIGRLSLGNSTSITDSDPDGNARGQISLYHTDSSSISINSQYMWASNNVTLDNFGYLGSRSTTKNTDGFAIFYLGNSAKRSTTTAHSEGILRLYSREDGYINIQNIASNYSNAYTHYLPQITGYSLVADENVAKTMDATWSERTSHYQMYDSTITTPNHFIPITTSTGATYLTDSALLNVYAYANTSSSGYARIILGNNKDINNTNNPQKFGTYGYITLYSGGPQFTNIVPQRTYSAYTSATENTPANKNFYLPQWVGSDHMYAVHTGHATNAVGGASRPVYIAARGRATAITSVGVAYGGTGRTTMDYKNAVLIGNDTTVTSAMQAIRTASGAFYATAQDAKPAFGTLPVAQGGTGSTTEEAARVKFAVDGIYQLNTGNYHTMHYIVTDLTLGTSATDIGVKIEVENSYSGKKPSIVMSSARWDGSAFVNATYYDPLGVFTSINYAAYDGTLYLNIDPANTYSHFRIRISTGTNRSHHIVSHSRTAPTGTATATAVAATKAIIPIASGGTGKATAAEAWTNLGGGSVGKTNYPTSNTTTTFLRGDGTWQAVDAGKLKTTLNTTGTYYILGMTGTTADSTAATVYKAATANKQVYINSSGVLLGAAWNNDYAEYRKDNIKEKECQQPGRCVKENGDGSLSITTKRLERGCEIISDTFGFAIGKNEEDGYNTPIASSGRVLAYPYESIEDFSSHIGWPVCSGPNGTVSIMTEEEEERYPSRIIGTISEIPIYKNWGADDIEVNGRVWIRIR